MSCDEITQVLQSHVKELGIFLSGLGNKWRFKKNFFLVTLGLQCRAQAEFLVAFWDLLDPGIEPASLVSSALADGVFTASATWVSVF